MKTAAKKARITITIDDDLVDMLDAFAEKNFGGNASRAINTLVRKEFLETRSATQSDGSVSGDEIEAFHSMLLRMDKEKNLPPWIQITTGEIKFDGNSFPYVKDWKMEPSDISNSPRHIVEALSKWIRSGKAPKFRTPASSASNPSKENDKKSLDEEAIESLRNKLRRNPIRSKTQTHSTT